MTTRSSPDTAAIRKIGGFFGLDLGSAPAEVIGRSKFTSVADRWFRGMAATQSYQNSRSALIEVCARSSGVRTLWLPTYICNDVLDAARSGASTVSGIKFYPLAKHGPVAPDCAFLASKLHDEDAVLVVNQFGRPPSAELLRLAARRRSVLWIEDRAQALWPGAPWGHALLYSPRKLVGVPDGGFLVIPRLGALADRFGVERPTKLFTAEHILPSLWRFEDKSEAHNDTWYRAYRQAEGAMRPGPDGASRLTLELLRRIDFTTLARRRRQNFGTLRTLLGKARKGAGINIPQLRQWVPQGYAVLVADAAATNRFMAHEGVFCPVLWPNMPHTKDCARTERLAGRVLLLPCDHRYGRSEMKRVAEVFLGTLNFKTSAFEEL